MTYETYGSRSDMGQLEAVFENMFDAVFILDPSAGKIVYANRAMRRLYGYSPAEALQLTIQDLTAMEAWESYTEVMDYLSLTALGAGQLFDWKARKKDGTVFWAETSLRKTVAAGNEQVIAVVRDITARKRMEEDLRLTQFFVDKAAIGIQRISEEGRILFTNEVVCRNLGYTHEELCSMTVFDIDPSFNLEKFRENRRSIRAVGSMTFESINRRRDGSIFPVEVTVTYLEYQGREISVSFIKDITMRKRAEEALKKSEARLKMAMDLARLVQWEYDPDSGMFSFNDQFYALYGTTAEREGGTLMSAGDYARRFILPEESAVVADGVAEVLADSHNQLEHRIIRPDGEVRFIVVRGEAVRDQSGRIVAIRGANQDITERKRTEELLRKSEAALRKLASELAQKNSLLRTLIDAIPDLIFYKDCNRNYLGCNRAFEAFAGQAEKELMGRSDLDIFRMDVAVSSREIDLEILSTEQPRINVEWMDYPDGRRVLLETLKTPFFDLEGEILGVVGVSRDISERKRMEDELLLSHLCIDKAAIGIFQLSLDEGNILRVNDSASRSLGYTSEELCAMNLFDIYPDLTGEDFADMKEKAVVSGSVTYEATHRRKDGSTFPVEIIGNILSFHGISTGFLFFRDITERKRAEDSIRESRAKYQAIVDSFDGLIYVCSQDYRVEFMNKKLIERTGRDAVGEHCYKVIHECDFVCPWCVNDRVFAGETIHWDMFSPKDNRWYEVLNVPILHADGSMSKHSMMVDINDRKLFEEELQRQKNLLKELNETLEKRVVEEVAKNREKDIMLIQQNRQAALGEMLDHIAHQWKQPLNSIALIIQYLGETARGGELTDELVKETIGKTMALLEHMAQTIDTFRGFYRPDKEKKVFSIKGSIDQALAFIAPAFRFHLIAVELDVDPGLTAFGYSKEFSQVLLNILANARDALRASGAGKPRVIIRAFAEGTKTVVTIADNGGGIPEAIIGRIFDFYFTTNEVSGGTGIGLYMSKKIIEKNMAGILSAENTEVGARFRIEIPTT